jgi:hypothetical protein
MDCFAALAMTVGDTGAHHEILWLWVPGQARDDAEVMAGSLQTTKEKARFWDGQNRASDQTASEEKAALPAAASRQLAQGISCGSMSICFSKRTSFQSPGLLMKA